MKALVDRARLECRAREQLPGNVLLQNRVDLHDPARVDVVALHQLFAGALAAGSGVFGHVAERGGDLRLVVEQQAVFAPPGGQVQARAQHLQKVLAPRQHACFVARDQLARSEFIPRRAEAGGTRDP